MEGGVPSQRRQLVNTSHNTTPSEKTSAAVEYCFLENTSGAIHRKEGGRASPKLFTRGRSEPSSCVSRTQRGKRETRDTRHDTHTTHTHTQMKMS